jgi:hypothetical protein
MRVRLKGLNSKRKRLADGSFKTYWWAWKGGPPLRGEPGTPEFIASYNEAAAAKIAQPRGTLLSVLLQYQDSDDFRSLADSTRRSYVPLIIRIEKSFGDFPLSALTDRRSRGVFMAWRDQLALSAGRRQADYAWTVLARVLSWSMNRGLIAANPCERGGRLYRGSRAEKIWTAGDEVAFLKRAPAHLHLPLLPALWTGQRQGDLLRLPWSAYDGTHIKLRQGKTGARVVIKVGAPLKAALDAAPKRSTIMLTNSDNKPWTSDGFRASWGKACKAAGRRRRHVQRLARYCGDPACTSRRDRSRDRHHHRALAARRACNPRYALSQPRPEARRQRHHQARKGNEISRLTSRLN